MSLSTAEIDFIVGEQDFGVASASKRGRNPCWPYVAVIVYPNARNGLGRTSNPLRGNAYRTRDEAVHAAQMAIDHRRAALRVALADPRMRALRRQYGLKEDLS